MCINPSFVWMMKGPEWVQQPVPCRVCDMCRKNRVNDFVGRGLCEVATSSAVSTVTLTYAPRDDLFDQIINPAHFQDFIRQLRDYHRNRKTNGFSLRYFAVGEFGKKSGRAHLHAILFFKGISSPWPHGNFINIPQWPHGHCTVDNRADYRTFRYCCKYLLKGDEKPWLSLSKKPPLGTDFILKKADALAALGVLPRSFTYRPPGAPEKVRFGMSRAIKLVYLRRILERVPYDEERASEWVRNVQKAMLREDAEKLYRSLPASYWSDLWKKEMDEKNALA